MKIIWYLIVFHIGIVQAAYFEKVADVGAVHRVMDANHKQEQMAMSGIHKAFERAKVVHIAREDDDSDVKDFREVRIVQHSHGIERLILTRDRENGLIKGYSIVHMGTVQASHLKTLQGSKAFEEVCKGSQVAKLVHVSVGADASWVGIVQTTKDIEKLTVYTQKDHENALITMHSHPLLYNEGYEKQKWESEPQISRQEEYGYTAFCCSKSGDIRKICNLQLPRREEALLFLSESKNRYLLGYSLKWVVLYLINLQTGELLLAFPAGALVRPFSDTSVNYKAFENAQKIGIDLGKGLTIRLGDVIYEINVTDRFVQKKLKTLNESQELFALCNDPQLRHSKRAQEIIQEHPNVLESTNELGQTPLHAALSAGAIDLVPQFNVAHMPKKLLSARDKAGKTVAQLAAEKAPVDTRYMDLLELFFSKSAVAYDKQDKNGETILHSILKVLVEQKKDPSQVTLHSKALAAFKKFLNAHPVDPKVLTIRDGQGRSLQSWAQALEDDFIINKMTPIKEDTPLVGLSEEDKRYTENQIKLLQKNALLHFEPLIISGAGNALLWMIVSLSQRHLIEPGEDDLFDGVIEKNAAIKELFKSSEDFVGQKKVPVILFLGAIDAYAHKKNGLSDLRCKALISQLSRETKGILPIMLSKSAQDIIEEVRSKCSFVTIKLSVQERIKMLREGLLSEPKVLISESQYRAFGFATEGLVQRDIETIVQSLLVRESIDNKALVEETCSYLQRKGFDDFERRSSLLKFASGQMRFKDLIGMKSEIKQFKAIARRITKEAKSEFCIVLAGPPGTGKTTLADAFAQEVGWLFYGKAATEFRKGIVGSGAEAVRAFFQDAQKDETKKVVFIDEIDLLAGRHVEGGGNEDKATLAQIWLSADYFLKKNQGVVIFATNNPENIDSALKSRSHIIEVLPLDGPARLEFVRTKLLQRTDVNKEVFEGPFLSELTNSMSWEALEGYDTRNTFTVTFSSRDLLKCIERAVLLKYEEKSALLEKWHLNEACKLLSPEVEINTKVWMRSQKQEFACGPSIFQS